MTRVYDRLMNGDVTSTVTRGVARGGALMNRDGCGGDASSLPLHRYVQTGASLTCNFL